MLRLLLSALALAAGDARACSIVTPGDFPLDPSSEEENPPWFPDATFEVSVSRGENSMCGMNGGGDCTDFAYIRVSFPMALDVEAAEDDEHYQTGVGYRLQVLEGAAPEYAVPEAPQGAWRDGDDARVELIWIERDGEQNEAFGFLLSITAVDAAGNESAPVEVWIEDPGREVSEIACEEPGGCGVMPRRGAAWGLGLLGLLAVARRRAAAE